MYDSHFFNLFCFRILLINNRGFCGHIFLSHALLLYDRELGKMLKKSLPVDFSKYTPYHSASYIKKKPALGVWK